MRIRVSEAYPGGPLEGIRDLLFGLVRLPLAGLTVLFAFAFLGCSGGTEYTEVTSVVPSGTASVTTLTQEGVPVPEHFFSMNGIIPFHHKASNDPQMQANLWEDLERRLEAMQALGVSSVRTDFWRAIMEPRPGEHDWPFPDRIMQEIETVGLEPFPILGSYAEWSPNYAPITPSERELLGNHVRAVVGRYKDQARYWEVWNEPNITPFWLPEPDPALYLEVQKVVYREAKAADPECQVVGLATSQADYEFIEEVYRLGGASTMDAVSFHPYTMDRDESVFEGEVTRIRQIMAEYGDAEKPLWITESGYTTGDTSDPNQMTRDEQASWIVKKHLIALKLGIERFYYFKLIDDHHSLHPDGYWGVLAWDFTEKPSAAAYRTMVSRVQDARFLGKMTPPVFRAANPESIEFLLFEKSRERFAVVWVRKNGPDMDISIPVQAPVAVESLDGLSMGEVLPEQGRATIPVGKVPVYLRSLDISHGW